MSAPKGIRLSVSELVMRYAVCYNSNVVTKTCFLEACDRPHYAKGLCKLHYKRAAAGIEQKPCEMCGGDTPKAGARFCSAACSMKWHRRFGCYTAAAIKAARGICSIESCELPVHANTFCRAHDMKRWRYGDPTADHSRQFGSPTCIRCGAERKPKDGSGKNLCATCYQNEYYHKNIEKERARRSYLEKITPPWADREAIRKIYAECPPGHEVDHVVPIKGRRVSGLHVENNLQYLSASANKRKLNRFDLHNQSDNV